MILDPQEIREKQCYGTTIKAFKKGLMFTNWDDPQSIIMLSMSIQSDVQELAAMAESEETMRQYLNLSKYCLGELSRLLNKKANG